MSEHIEWIEPEEVTCERRESMRAVMREVSGVSVRWSLLLGVPTVLLVFWMEPEQALAVSAIIPMLMCIGPVHFSPLLLFCLDRSEVVCSLDLQGVKSKSRAKGLVNSSCQWKSTRSFEIVDHPTLPNIRRLTIHHQRAPHKLQLDFRIGQLDEVELRDFVESRIAEQRVGRLMRRVRRSL